MTDPLDMRGRSVVVAGGGRGVGRGIATRFPECGADVFVCGRNEPDALPAAEGRKALFTPADVREVEQIERVVSFTLERFGRLDVLVNNAGGAPEAAAATASPRFHESILRLNLIAPIHFSQKANAVMQEQSEGGVIINISSISAIRPSPGTAVYSAAKAGLLQLTRSLAVEWAPKVRVVAVTAGMIETELSELHYGDAEGIAAVGRTVPLGRLGQPADVGDACVFLASPLASYVSGASLLMDGGGEAPAFLGAANRAKD